MNATIAFFSASGEKLADAVGMTGIAPVNSEIISVHLSARNVTGVQKDNNALNILTKDNKKIVINDFFSNKEKKLVFDDGKEIFAADYAAGEQFNGLQFKPLESIDALFEGTDTPQAVNEAFLWVVPVIAVAAVSGIAIAASRGSSSNANIESSDNTSLSAAKTAADQAIDGMGHLSDQQKADAHQAVADATDLAGVEKAQADAATANLSAANLSAAKTAADQAIDGMIHLSDQQKADAHQAIVDATDLASVEKAQANAAADNLSAAKITADQAVNEMAWLTETQKTAACDAIQAAATLSEVDNTLVDAGVQNLDAAKADATQAVGDMAYLSDAQKELANQTIQVANGVSGVEKALADAVADNLTGAKETADNAIDEMANLSDDQKTAAHKAVEDATSVSLVEQALVDAAQLNENEEEQPSSFLEKLLQLVENIAGGIWDVVTAIPKGLLLAAKTIISLFTDYHFLLESAPAKITDAALVVFEGIIDVIYAPISFISKLAQWVTGFTANLLGGVWEPLGFIPQVANNILVTVDAVLNGIKTTIQTLGTLLISVPASLLGAISSGITLIKDSLGLSSSDDTSGNVINNFIDKILAFIDTPSSFIETITGLVSSIFSSIGKIISDPLGAIGTLISNVIGTITDVIMAPIKFVGNIISSIVDVILSPFKGIIDGVDTIIDAITHPFETIGNLISGVIEAIGSIISNPLGTLGDVFSSIIEFITSAVKGIIDTITHPIDTITSLISGVIESISDFLTGKNSDSTASDSDELANAESTLADLALYNNYDADTDVISLPAIEETANDSQVNESLDHVEALALQESLDSTVGEGEIDTELASLLEENSANDINLDSLIGEESAPALIADNAPETYDVPDQLAYQLQLAEENYNLAAA